MLIDKPRQMMELLNRREFLRNVGALVATHSSKAVFALAQSKSPKLRDIVRPGIRIGAQATLEDLDNPELAAFIAGNFNTLTAGHEFKWAALRPSPSTYDFTKADRMLAFAERSHMHFRGHTLCWNHWLPNWVAYTVNEGNAERYLQDHIATVAGRYAGRIDSWDVVNEPTGTWRTAQGQPPRPWLDLIGPQYIDLAFHAAASADPKALRVLNFDRLEQPGTATDTDRARVLELLKGLVKRNVPVQAVGFESHLAAWDAVENTSQDRLIRSIRDLGLKMMITELDVTDTKVDGAIGHRDEVVADTYYQYLMKNVPKMDAQQVIFWSPSDATDGFWMDHIHGNYDRTDGLPHRPGMVDGTMKQKPAYASVSKALQQLFGPGPASRPSGAVSSGR